MNHKQFKFNQSYKRLVGTFAKHTSSIIVIVIGGLLGFGISQLPQFNAVHAESEKESLAQLREEFNALKAKQAGLNAQWQSELLKQIVPTLADESDKVKRQFLDFLEEIGSAGIAALTEMLNDSSVRIREKAVDALGEIGEHERKAGRSTDAAAIGLAKALGDTSAKVRDEALEELDDVRIQSSTSIEIVVPALIAVRTKGSSSQRAEVLDVLGRIGELASASGQNTDTIRDALISSLSDNSTKVRTNAIDELSDIQTVSAETLTALIGALADSSKSVREKAEGALIELGKQAHTTLAPMLASALKNSESALTRGAIVDVLGALGESGNAVSIVVPALLQALTDTSDDVRRNAADELGEMRATLPEVLEALKIALNDTSSRVRKSAKTAIRRIEKAK